jgi:hypothetical protein
MVFSPPLQCKPLQRSSFSGTLVWSIAIVITENQKTKPPHPPLHHRILNIAQ